MKTNQRPVDRRIAKTKRLLSQALVDLILEKGYDAVTIADILDRADVGRSTFYAHYESKEMLLLNGPRNLGHALFGEAVAGFESSTGQHPMAFHGLFQHVSENKMLANAMLGKNASRIMLTSFCRQIAVAVRNRYHARRGSGKAALAKFGYKSQAAADAVGSLLASWIDDDFVLSVADVSTCCRDMVEGIFRLDEA